ncbi:arginine--tRNA ligase [Alkalihalobacillus pseudalcaliphilus]|uniref:arginine--tRNA ligase n=1 Tax=Alkalihalobacillus pseudalcaliphilus TaxID=79884 RepID=UPI00064D9020|nr:arginine--tRNA ligase [Alkalihalobacillus pseudalcaliphilus]KMK75328.1 arginine--tRNA ligase [Alkalihalobacillus pseudalcaliphilus]
MSGKLVFIEQLEQALKGLKSKEEIEVLLEKPKFEEQGDLAFPCFTLAKEWKKSPQLIATEMSKVIESEWFERVEAAGPYLNVFLQKGKVSQSVIQSVLEQGCQYGSNQQGVNQTITIDYSSPNIAKPFSMGHLRSTVIGNALANMSEKNGFKAVRINHLGDWGTQFGKLMVAYKNWGEEEKVKQSPIRELLALYVKFHEEAEQAKELEEEARAWFKKLEDQDTEATQLWTWFKDESLKEFEKIYKLLDVPFDSYHGEAFYNNKMDAVIRELEKKGLLERSEGADVVSLHEAELPPCLIRKSDGATLYATRDLAAALYRKSTYNFSHSLYVVGHEQSLHFQQLKLVLNKMGHTWSEQMEHIPFGFILQKGRKMSTRKGRVILLEQVIEEAIQLAEKNINEKNPELANKQQVAREVGVGSIIFHDLKNEKQNNVEFSLEDMLRFEGTTGPYVQYTHARACSILRKASLEEFGTVGQDLTDDYSWKVVKQIEQFPIIVQRSFEWREPSKIAKYVLELAQEFNKYYSHVKILVDDQELKSRIALVKAVTIVLNEGLRLLGIKAPEQM